MTMCSNKNANHVCPGVSMSVILGDLDGMSGGAGRWGMSSGSVVPGGKLRLGVLDEFIADRRLRPFFRTGEIKVTDQIHTGHLERGQSAFFNFILNRHGG